MEAQLARLDLTQRYQRFAAVDADDIGLRGPVLTAGELGCFTSHYELLQRHLDGASHLHIIEDDVILAKGTAQFVECVISSGMLDEFDLLFTDMVVPLNFDFYRGARGHYRNDIQRTEDGSASIIQFSTVDFIACTASYLVNKRSIGRVCDVFRRELESGPNRPIDLFGPRQGGRGRISGSMSVSLHHDGQARRF